MDVVQRNVIDIPVARGKWADEGDVHRVSLQYRCGFPASELEVGAKHPRHPATLVSSANRTV
jgi:hypothetical protein